MTESYLSDRLGTGAYLASPGLEALLSALSQENLQTNIPWFGGGSRGTLKPYLKQKGFPSISRYRPCAISSGPIHDYVQRRGSLRPAF